MPDQDRELTREEMILVEKIRHAVGAEEEMQAVEAIEAHVRRSPPNCLASFRAFPLLALDRSDESIRAEWHSAIPFKSLWRLQCKCGCYRGGLLGHYLRDYNQDYHGDEMVTPIGFKCSTCAQVTEILDTGIHGYHAEVSKLEGGTGSAKIRGAGEHRIYHCKHCGNDTFGFVTGFVYWHFDIIFDEPELPAQNFFNEFLMLCTCGRCGRGSEPVMLGKL